MRIDHVQLAIPPATEDTQREFWIDLLGFAEVPKPDPLSSRGGLWLVHGEARLHLGVEKDHRPAKKAHPAFVTDDLTGLAERLDQAGFPPRWDTTIPETRRFFVFDPAGNRVELMEHT